MVNKPEFDDEIKAAQCRLFLLDVLLLCNRHGFGRTTVIKLKTNPLICYIHRHTTNKLALIPSLSALRNVTLPCLLRGEAEDEARAAELLTAVGLEKRVDHLPSQLSGGEHTTALATLARNKIADAQYGYGLSLSLMSGATCRSALLKTVLMRVSAASSLPSKRITRAGVVLEARHSPQPS